VPTIAKDLIVFTLLLSFGLLAVVAFLFSVLKKQKNRKKDIIENKRRAASVADAVLEEKKRMEEHEENEVLLQNAENMSDIVYLRRTMVNLTSVITNLLKHIPETVRLDSNILADQLSFATSVYIKKTLRELIDNSIKNGADHITIDHKELVKSNRLIYRDNRKSSMDDKLTVMHNMAEYDPMFDLKVNRPSGLFSFDLDFVFTKSNEPRIVGKFYTSEEIDRLYGEEVIHEVQLSLNDYKSYLNLSGAYTFFRLEDDEFSIAKEEDNVRKSINSDKVYPKDLVFRYFSTSMLRDLIGKNRAEKITFQNRLKDGKITFVVNHGRSYLQRSKWCPELCPDKLNGILH
jgi:hypothetical protein